MKQTAQRTKAERAGAWSGTVMLICLAAAVVMLTIKFGLVLFT